MGTATLVEILLAIFLPPVGVFLRFGCGGSDSLNSMFRTRQDFKFGPSVVARNGLDLLRESLLLAGNSHWQESLSQSESLTIPAYGSDLGCPVQSVPIKDRR